MNSLNDMDYGTPKRESAVREMPSRIGRYQIIRELGHGGSSNRGQDFITICF